jgi:hypothetical protein
VLSPRLHARLGVPGFAHVQRQAGPPRRLGPRTPASARIATARAKASAFDRARGRGARTAIGGRRGSHPEPEGDPGPPARAGRWFQRKPTPSDEDLYRFGMDCRTGKPSACRELALIHMNDPQPSCGYYTTDDPNGPIAGASDGREDKPACKPPKYPRRRPERIASRDRVFRDARRQRPGDRPLRDPQRGRRADPPDRQQAAAVPGRGRIDAHDPARRQPAGSQPPLQHDRDPADPTTGAG